EAVRELAADATDAELSGAFDTAVRHALAAWDAGSFYPQLAQPGKPEKEGEACRSCDVREACLRGDSSARARLVAATARPERSATARSARAASPAAERALRGLWSRGDAP